MFKVFVFLLSFIFSVQLANAQSNMIGYGLTPCREIIQSTENELIFNSLFAWATGFVSGINVTLIERENKFKIIDSISKNSLSNKIRIYCARRPHALFAEVVEDMFRELPEQDFKH